MNNKLVKYEQNGWNKIISKLKTLLRKQEIEADKYASYSKEISSDKDINEKYEKEKKKFVELITQLQAGTISEMELQIDEIKMLTKYYEQENKKLDEVISKQNKKIRELNLELNRAYEKAIKLKAYSGIKML